MNLETENFFENKIILKSLQEKLKIDYLKQEIQQLKEKYDFYLCLFKNNDKILKEAIRINSQKFIFFSKEKIKKNNYKLGSQILILHSNEKNIIKDSFYKLTIQKKVSQTKVIIYMYLYNKI